MVEINEKALAGLVMVMKRYRPELSADEIREIVLKCSSLPESITETEQYVWSAYQKALEFCS